VSKDINLEELLTNNSGVDAELLKKAAEMDNELGPKNCRYKYNLVPPFAGRMFRHPAAEVGGSDDNVRRRQ